MVAEEQTPLAVLGDAGVCVNMSTIGCQSSLADTHKQPRHQGKMKCHMTFIAVAEIRADIGGPLISLPPAGCVPDNAGRSTFEILQYLVRLRQVFTAGALPFNQITTASHGIHQVPDRAKKAITSSMAFRQLVII